MPAPDPAAIRAANIEELYRLAVTAAAVDLSAGMGAGRRGRAAAGAGDGGADRDPERRAGPVVRHAVAPRDGMAAGGPADGARDPAGVALRDVGRGRRSVVRAAPGGDHRARLAARAHQDAGSGRAQQRESGRVAARSAVPGSRSRPGARAAWSRRAIRRRPPPSSTSTTAWTGPTWRPSAADSRCPA